MRVFVAVLVLIFSLQSWTKADDISDFEIEGMSLGDSLLDYYSRDQIGKEMTSEFPHWYKNNKFIAISLWEIRKSFKTYNDVGVIFKPEDYISYEIFSVYGKLHFKDKKIVECHKKQKEIATEIKKAFSEIVLKEKEWFDPKPEQHLLSVKYLDLFLNDGKIRVVCYDRKKNKDLLTVSINGTEFTNFLIESAKN